MKKKLAIVLAVALLALSIAACGQSAAPAASAPAAEAAAPAAESVKLTVGASSTPHAELLELVKPALAEQGIELDIVIYDDYVLPNTALQDGELDANYFQHTPYLNSFNESNGTDLVSAGLIHYEPFGIYSKSVAALADLADGATILVPDDESNQTRALLLLAQEDLVVLPEGASVENGVSVLDIVDAKGYDIQAAQADAIPSLLANADEGTIAVINYNYALGAGFKTSDALAIEDASGDAAQTYANIIAVRRGDETRAEIIALIAALQDGAVDAYNEQTGAGIVPISCFFTAKKLRCPIGQRSFLLFFVILRAAKELPLRISRYG